jgi:general stress protein 26
MKEDYMEYAKHIRECLDSTIVGVLATNEGHDGSWATPVYFTYDSKFNFYFMSEERSRHVKDIESNPNVSLAIFMPIRNSLGFKVGLQIAGRAEVVPDDRIEEIYMQRSIRLTGTKAWNKDSIGGHVMRREGWTFIKIVPTMMNYVDRRYSMGDSIKISVRKLAKSSEYLSA